MTNDIWIDKTIGEAVGEANKTSYTTVLTLPLGTDKKLRYLTYEYANGVPARFELPNEYEDAGYCSVVIDGKPIDITNLGDGRVELHFPLGMHEHAKKDDGHTVV